MTLKVISQNIVNIYNEPNTASEVVSQALLGSTVEVVDNQESFIKIKTVEQYTGWVSSQLVVDAWNTEDYLSTNIATLFADVYKSPDPKSELITKLVVSSKVYIAHAPEIDDFVPIILPDRTIGYIYRLCLDVAHNEPNLNDENIRIFSKQQDLDYKELKSQVIRAIASRALNNSIRFIGTPYLWGGCSPFGLDCSGFVQLSYKLAGLQLLRDGYQQFGDRRFERCDNGYTLDEADLLAGDLVAFTKPSAFRISHIGIAIGDGRFIHSSGDKGVNIESCNSAYYSEIFSGAVRLSPNANLTIEAA